MCDSLNREPFDEAVAIENSHQHNGTKSRATKRLAISPLKILQPLDYKEKIACHKVLKLIVFDKELYVNNNITGEIIVQNCVSMLSYQFSFHYFSTVKVC